MLDADTKQEELQKIQAVEDYWRSKGYDKELELAPFSPEGKLQFHLYMKDLAQKLLKDELNLDQDGLVFLFSSSPIPNAAYVHHTKDKQDFIFITKGLIDMCENKDQLAFILAHELQHFMEEKKHGDHNNSKLEEGYADLNAIHRMSGANLNIEQAHNIAQKIFDNSKINLDTLADVHITDVNRIKLLDVRILAEKETLINNDTATNDIIGDITHPFEEDFSLLIENAPKFQTLRDYFTSEEYQSKSYEEKIDAWIEKFEQSLSIKETTDDQDTPTLSY